MIDWYYVIIFRIYWLYWKTGGLIRIIYRDEDSYIALLPKAKSLNIEKMCYSLFNQIQEPHHKLHHLLLPEWINSRSTRNAKKYEPPKVGLIYTKIVSFHSIQLIQFPEVTRILCFINGYENTSFTIITWTSLHTVCTYFMISNGFIFYAI